MKFLFFIVFSFTLTSCCLESVRVDPYVKYDGSLHGGIGLEFKERCCCVEGEKRKEIDELCGELSDYYKKVSKLCASCIDIKSLTEQQTCKNNCDAAIKDAELIKKLKEEAIAAHYAWCKFECQPVKVLSDDGKKISTLMTKDEYNRFQQNIIKSGLSPQEYSNKKIKELKEILQKSKKNLKVLQLK